MMDRMISRRQHRANAWRVVADVKLYRTVAIVVFATISALCAMRVDAQAPGAINVLGPTPVDTKAIAKIDDAVTVKARIARPELVALDAIARRHLATRQKSRFVIDLFPGLDIEAEVIDAQARDDGVTLFARLTDLELGSAVFTITNGVMTATVDFPGGSYLVTPQRDGTHKVAQLAQELFPPERQPRTRFSIDRSNSGFGAFGAEDVPTDSGRLIDIMVVWTPTAEAEAGGLLAMQSLAQAAVDSANAAYLNSGIAQRLRLVHRQQVAYTERTSCGDDIFGCALDDLSNVGDGYMDAVDTLRNQHGADLVALLIRNDPGICGLGWLPSTPSQDAGFSVTAHGCAVGNRSFAHEVGHNMGAHHDPANATAIGPKPFNRGYLHPGSQWRTIMAYNACPSGPCTRIAHFSNPKLTFSGSVMGTAAVSNNAHVLNFTAKLIAAYRPTSALHPVPQRFADVATNHPFYGHIEFFAQAEITTGCGAGLFCPDASVSRRQMAAFIERAMRASNWTPASGNTAFTDVVDGSLFAGHIEAMRTDGITSGCGSLLYCPESEVSRAQMAVFVLRARCGAAYSPSLPPTQTFADVPHSLQFANFIEKMYALGITGGCATGPLRYCPGASVTRGQMATFIERAYPFLTPSEACSP